MNIEEIKIITDMIVSLGAQGKEAFIIWLVMTQGISLIKLLSFFAAIVYCVNRIVRVVFLEDHMREVYKIVVGCDCGYFFDKSSIDKIKDKLNERKD